MIDADYCRLMARYNAWQNRQLIDVLDEMPAAEVVRDRGAFFGSILGTLNHLLWGDLMWMARFDGGAAPACAMADSPTMLPTVGAWSAERFRMDGRISRWAGTLTNVDLAGQLAWFSGVLQSDVSRPVALCVAHFFNHQTHHRGQVHAMLTAAGARAPVSDIFLMPEEM